MYKKFTKILLLIILLSPLSVYALKDRVTVSSTGWNYDYFQHTIGRVQVQKK